MWQMFVPELIRASTSCGLIVFGVSKNIMLIFYRATIESILQYGITSWFGNLIVKSKTQIFNLVKTASKIMETPAPLNPQELFDQATISQAKTIQSDSSHLLYPEYILLNSGRRHRVSLCKHNRYTHSSPFQSSSSMRNGDQD